MGTTFESYRDAFPNARLSRDEAGVLEIALHTDGGKLIFNGHTHEQFVDLFHQVGAGVQGRRRDGGVRRGVVLAGGVGGAGGGKPRRGVWSGGG